MSDSTPFFREAGAGPSIVALHSNASVSAQWRPLMERLAGRYHVLAPDSLGAGRSPAWPVDRAVTLRDEAEFLEPVFARAGKPFWLVGHSYGGAIALIAALNNPQAVRGLVLYEPVLFSLLDEQADREAIAGIRNALTDATAEVDAGNTFLAGQRFIDYWMGDGTWQSFPAPKQDAVAASMVNVRGWSDAVLSDRYSLDVFRELELPVLLMSGGRSPASSRGVARLLAEALPNVTPVELADLGHMGPVTDPDAVNLLIDAFVAGSEYERAAAA
ncbi:MAG TPA: alpha/beta fold hydrolase [Gemmatimonadales bacterium]|nr:alpha/beta fold hydrolase [Gemmatimonadales bacterium]